MNEEQFAALRQHMILEIATHTALLGERIGRYNLDPRVMEVMGKVPRHLYVPVEIQPYAYLNRPLPIGYDKTISQPFIAALMTDLLDAEPGDRVLEVGTGLGYHAAVLTELGARVYSVEIVEELGEQAVENLRRNGYKDIETRIGDGSRGWMEHAPFDRILVCAAPELIPPVLIGQLKPGGKMVVPAGVAGAQQLMLVEKDDGGRLSSREVLAVNFSPLEVSH